MVTACDDDLKSAYEYIKRDSDVYSNRLVEITIEKCELLNEFPKTGRIVPEFKNESYREVFIYSYRLIYKISDSKIIILAFIHSARDLTSINL